MRVAPGESALPEVKIRPMEVDDIDRIMRTFARWHKTRAQYERYWREQQRGERDILLALWGDRVGGYVTRVWASKYAPFRERGIPEIVDLNVITEYQRRGIGTALIRAAERLALQRGRNVIGISVVQSPEYAAANRLYPKLGYVPDGRGITPHDNELHLTRELR